MCPDNRLFMNFKVHMCAFEKRIVCNFYLQVTVFWLSTACAVIPIVLGTCMIFLPESPLYLLKKGHKAKARESLQWFRGEYYDAEPELNEMQKNLDEVIVFSYFIFICNSIKSIQIQLIS